VLNLEVLNLEALNLGALNLDGRFVDPARTETGVVKLDATLDTVFRTQLIAPARLALQEDDRLPVQPAWVRRTSSSTARTRLSRACSTASAAAARTRA
jgi:hypothetical protein